MLADASGHAPTILVDVYKPPVMTLFGEADEPPLLVWDDTCGWYVDPTWEGSR